MKRPHHCDYCAWESVRVAGDVRSWGWADGSGTWRESRGSCAGAIIEAGSSAAAGSSDDVGTGPGSNPAWTWRGTADAGIGGGCWRTGDETPRLSSAADVAAPLLHCPNWTRAGLWSRHLLGTPEIGLYVLFAKGHVYEPWLRTSSLIMSNMC